MSCLDQNLVAHFWRDSRPTGELWAHWWRIMFKSRWSRGYNQRQPWGGFICLLKNTQYHVLHTGLCRLMWDKEQKKQKPAGKPQFSGVGIHFGFGETTDCGVIDKECLIKQDYHEKLASTDQIIYLSSVPRLPAHISYGLCYYCLYSDDEDHLDTLSSPTAAS